MKLIMNLKPYVNFTITISQSIKANKELIKWHATLSIMKLGELSLKQL
jgi:hypothetical protein